MTKLQVFTQEEIGARLQQSLPNWHNGEGFIHRTFKTLDWKATLMVANAIGHLAEAAWHHPELSLSFARVEVRLQTHDMHGITERDFELARKIEDVIGWQPGKTSRVLEVSPGKDG